MPKGPWVEAARCSVCQDGWVPTFFGDEPAHERVRLVTTVVKICRTCGSKLPWERRIIGRKVYPWWDVFGWSSAKWEWAPPTPPTPPVPPPDAALRDRLIALGLSPAEAAGLSPAEAWRFLHEVDPFWYKDP